MTYRQKLTKIGNSVGLVIPKEIRDVLGIDVGSELYLGLSADKKSVVLDKVMPSSKLDSTFFDLVKKVDEQYAQALTKLASKSE